ncbi:MAG: cation transporter [Proteobacteria bacterium]|nr:heavy-metal-associated domain-containing protein [Desulfobulbaceae bacterium]MBU4153795.1 cation transporter [Pseudomonadota bacterium]MDP2104764.1 cation transporter [Desulfobulbaceae bacterium]
MPIIKINGMSCGHCSASVTKALNDIDGLTDISVNLEKKEARYTETKPVALDTIKEAITKIGFEVV